MPGKIDWVTIVPAAAEDDDGQEAIAADHNEAWSVKRMDSAAAISVFDVDNIGIAATTGIGGGGWGLNNAAEVETAAEMTAAEVVLFALLELLDMAADLFGHCFRGRLIKVLTSWPVSGSNLSRFLAPFRRPRFDFLLSEPTSGKSRIEVK